MYFYSRMIFFYCLLLYSILSIGFSKEEQIHDFLHLLRIRSLNEEIASDIQKHKQTYGRNTGITGTPRTFFGRPYTRMMRALTVLTGGVLLSL